MQLTISELNELEYLFDELAFNVEQLYDICVHLKNTDLADCEEMQKNILDLNHYAYFFDYCLRLIHILIPYYWSDNNQTGEIESSE